MAVWAATGLDGSVEYSHKMKNKVCWCSKGDVVKVIVDEEAHVARVNYHINVTGKCLSCVTFWHRLRDDVYRIGTEVAFVYSNDIVGVCVHANVSDTLEIVVPAKC